MSWITVALWRKQIKLAWNKQVTFWVEGSRFLLSELDVWERLGNTQKCAEIVHILQGVLNHLRDLLEQMP